MLLEHEGYYGLGMDALVTVRSCNRMLSWLWAWMLWSPYVLGTRRILWFGHRRMLLEHECCHGCGHGCPDHHMLLEHEGYHGLGMDALVTVCSWSMNFVIVWAWMLCSWRANIIMVWAWMLFNESKKRTNFSGPKPFQLNHGAGAGALVTLQHIIQHIPIYLLMSLNSSQI